jgi:hypothetical protein
VRIFGVVAVIAICLAGCGVEGHGAGAPATIDDVTLLRHGGSPDDAYPAALGRGELVVLHGCLAMEGDVGPPAYILWPPSFDLRRRDGRVEVVDGDGDLVAAPGDPISIGGGWGGLSWAQDLTEGSIPASCRDRRVERYFLASGAWPFAEADDTTLLRHDGDSLVGEEAVLTGVLSVIEGCVGIEGGPWLLWPIGYGLSQDQTPPIEILDDHDRSVARIGDHVRIGGGIDDAMPDPAGLPGGIPDECRLEGEHYWYVGMVERAAR